MRAFFLALYSTASRVTDIPFRNRALAILRTTQGSVVKRGGSGVDDGLRE